MTEPGIDLSALTDEELDDRYQQVIVERDRRRELAALPAQIKGLTDKFIACGGDPAELE